MAESVHRELMRLSRVGHFVKLRQQEMAHILLDIDYSALGFGKIEGHLSAAHRRFLLQDLNRYLDLTIASEHDKGLEQAEPRLDALYDYKKYRQH